ncbi:PRTG.2 family protein [Megaselia abdita]
MSTLSKITLEALVFSGTGQVEVPGPNISFIEQPPFQVNVFDGKDYFLTCRLNLSFPGNVTQTVWFRGEHKVRAERDGTLKLSGNRNSAGVYRCLVNQTYLSTSSHVVYPVFQRDPLLDKSRTPVEGTSIILDCPFTSIPKANITWTFGDSGKISDNRFLKFSNGSLLIKNIKQSNSGRYTCKAENLYARKNKTHRQLTYEVTVKPTTNNSINNKHLLPRLQADVQYIPLGGTLRLQCDSQSSDGDVKIMWTLWRTENGRKVITPNNFVLENSNRSLIVGNLTNAHYGNYTCQNEYGEQTFQVLRQQKPIIKTPLKSIACILNAPINLTCEATGAPKPKITWFRNGQLLSNNYTMEINESSLLIQSFDINDEGIYQCFAQNSAGETQSLGELRLTENMKQKLDTLPKPLMNLKCSPIDIGAVNISFEAPSLVSIYIFF